MTEQDNNKNNYYWPFIVGAVSGTLPCAISQPIDNIKVVIQMKRAAAGKNVADVSPFRVGKSIFQEQGVRGLYRALDSAILRESIYCGIRMGLYKLIEDFHKDQKQKNLSLGEKILFSLFTGALGSAVANPTDVSLVRVQADRSLAETERRNYRNVLHALSTILREEGWKGFWAGASPSIARATILNCSHLVSYHHAKETLLKYYDEQTETGFLRFVSSAISGAMVSFLSLPFDNARTKMMVMKANISGKLPYHSLLDCFRKSVRQQGFMNLWVGLPTYYFRVAPHQMLALLIQDYLHDELKDQNLY